MPQRRKEIFISYAREDLKYAISIKTLLENDGHKVWIDFANGKPGAFFKKEIRDKLNTVDFVVFLLSKESIKPNRVVAEELAIVIDLQRNFDEECIFLIAIKINNCDIPEVLTGQTWLEFTDEGKGKLRDIIYKEPLRSSKINLTEKEAPVSQPPWWKKKAVRLAFFLFLLLNFLVCYYVFYRERALHLKVTVNNIDSGYRIPGVVAFILGETNDTVVKSAPSANDGILKFKLESFPQTAYTVRFYHPDYYDTAADYKLTEEAGNRYMKMRRRPVKNSLPPAPVISKTYRFSGLQLTQAEMNQVKNETGYAWNAAGTAVFHFEYDHTALMQLGGTDKYTFAGSRIWLEGIGKKVATGIELPAMPSPPFPKAQLEEYLDDKMNELTLNNRPLVIKTLIQCLQKF